MQEPPSYANRLRTKACRETTRFIQHKLLTGAAVAISAVIMRLALWSIHRVSLTWTEVWINLFIIAGSYVIVFIGAFVVNLFRAPWLLDAERAQQIAVVAEKLEQRTGELASLTEKLEASNRQSQTGTTFANLIEDGKALELRMFTSQTGADFSPLGLQLNDWIKRVEHALIECGLLADASIFVHSGERPSDEQMKAIPFHLTKQVWKHYDIARITAYLAKFQEIVERRNL
jgi:hypothetical protein